MQISDQELSATLLPQNYGIMFDTPRDALREFDNLGKNTKWAKACFCAVLRHFTVPNKYDLVVEKRSGFGEGRHGPIYDAQFLVKHIGHSSKQTIARIYCEVGPDHVVIRVQPEDEDSDGRLKTSFKKEWRRGYRVKRSMAKFRPRNSGRRPKWNKFGAHTLHTLGQLFLKETVQYIMES